MNEFNGPVQFYSLATARLSCCFATASRLASATSEQAANSSTHAVKAATNSAVEKFASATTRSCCFASTIGVAAIAAAARCTAYSNRNFFGDAL